MWQKAVIAGVLIAAAVPAHAQSSAWGPNGYVSINSVYQGDAKSFADDMTVMMDNEPGNVTARHELTTGPAFDITAGGRLKGNLGMGFGASYFRRPTSASVTATVPHPFYFNRLRPVAGSASGLTRQELAAHVHLMWQIPFSERFQALVFGGPSRFVVKQMMVQNVEYAESYPYDDATFVSVKPVQQRAVRIGYNAGADLTFFFSKYVGVGAMLRVSRATVPLKSPDNDELKVKAGGTQFGGGMRFRF